MAKTNHDAVSTPLQGTSFPVVAKPYAAAEVRASAPQSKSDDTPKSARETDIPVGRNVLDDLRQAYKAASDLPEYLALGDDKSGTPIKLKITSVSESLFCFRDED
ncbi:MAG: hypothetical protein WAM82_31050 [Thermoanaerobaculia bacterium]